MAYLCPVTNGTIIFSNNFFITTKQKTCHCENREKEYSIGDDGKTNFLRRALASHCDEERGRWKLVIIVTPLVWHKFEFENFFFYIRIKNFKSLAAAKTNVFRQISTWNEESSKSKSKCYFFKPRQDSLLRNFFI